MSRLKASSSFAVRCPPGFAKWAKEVLRPETFDLIKCDRESCMKVLGAYVVERHRERQRVGQPVPKHPSHD